MTTEPTKEPKRQKAESGEQRKKRNRSKKLRPQSAESLALAIQDNRLDGRTRAAQDMKALRDAIAEDPQAAAKGLVRDTLAANATIMTAVLRELTGPGVKLIGDDGAVHPLIAKTWPELQRATITAARVLSSLERGGSSPTPSPDNGEVDLSTLILEAQRDDSTD